MNKELYSLFLDDEREPKTAAPFGYWRIARSFNEAKDILRVYGVPAYISFDHDLGEADNATGYDFAKYFCYYISFSPIKILKFQGFNVHSANPVGAKNIQCYMENFAKHLKEKYEWHN